MNWRHCTVFDQASARSLQDRFVALFVEAGAPANWALFSRCSRDRRTVTFVLTPAAGLLVARLGGAWKDAVDPADGEWTLAAGHPDAFERFAVPRPLSRPAVPLLL